jgi:excisionase family DNA binding protein
MSELLTTRELQELLKVDRITIYRMLNDGRMKGMKVGNQWRFPQGEVDRLLGETTDNSEPAGSEAALTDFPAYCVQMVQGIYAGIIGIGAVTVSLRGETLTEPTYSNPFCRLILSNPSGCQACQASWRRIALRIAGAPSFQICHAGLSYQRAVIQIDGQPAAWLIGGQFRTTAEDSEKLHVNLEQLSIKHDIALTQLEDVARKIPVLKKYQQEQVREWTPKVASTIDSILCERSDLMNRLQRIAEISAITNTLSKP